MWCAKFVRDVSGSMRLLVMIRVIRVYCPLYGGDQRIRWRTYQGYQAVAAWEPSEPNRGGARDDPLQADELQLTHLLSLHA